MRPDLVSLSQICPTWKGGIIPSAFADLLRGIERERARFKGLPYVVREFRREYDYDGLTENLRLCQGFTKQADAVAFAEELSSRTLASFLDAPSDNTWGKWQLDSSWENVTTFAPDIPVQHVHQNGFKIKLERSMYDSKYFSFSVFHVTAPEIVGQALFELSDAQSEWERYLIDKGKEEGG